MNRRHGSGKQWLADLASLFFAKKQNSSVALHRSSVARTVAKLNPL
jgi:hypothetical protein